MEYTGSRPIAAVKPCWAMLVLSWVTRWEYMVLLASYLFFYFIFFCFAFVREVEVLLREPTDFVSEG